MTPPFRNFSWEWGGYKKTTRSPIRAREVVRRDVKHVDFFKVAKCWCRPNVHKTPHIAVCGFVLQV